MFSRVWCSRILYGGAADSTGGTSNTGTGGVAFPLQNPQPACETSRSPSFEYDSLGNDGYRTSEMVFLLGIDAKTAAKADYEAAKAMYKAARKRAGKSNVPKLFGHGGVDYSGRISAQFGHSVGLCSNGTVIAAGWNDDGQRGVSEWNLF